MKTAFLLSLVTCFLFLARETNGYRPWSAWSGDRRGDSSSSSESGGNRKKCYFAGRWYNHGDNFKKGNCLTCWCYFGRIVCKWVVCYERYQKLPCKNPVLHPGKCCRECPERKSCTYKGKVLKPGETIHPDPCTKVTCDPDGEIIIAVVDCARPPCDHYYKLPGQCCSQCLVIKDRDCKHPDTGATIKHGETDDSNPCKPCTCDDGEVSCAVFRCPKPKCPKPHKVKGLCCPCCTYW